MHGLLSVAVLGLHLLLLLDCRSDLLGVLAIIRQPRNPAQPAPEPMPWAGFSCRWTTEDFAICCANDARQRAAMVRFKRRV